MPLTPVQTPTTAEFYASVRSIADEMDSRFMRWSAAAEWLAGLNSADLDAIGVPADAAFRTQLVNFRTAVEQLTAFYNGTGTARTNVPDTVMARFRRMLII